MSSELLGVAFLAWAGAAALCLLDSVLPLVRGLLVVGCLAGILAALASLPGGIPIAVLPVELAGETIAFHLSPDALWLFGFGLVPAALACALASPARDNQAGWLFGAAASLIGALDNSFVFGVGALFAAMSLAAMPPQAGFVSEWYVFQTVFQGFHLNSLTSLMVMALAGAGLALTVAVVFATFVKAFGVGLLGRTSRVYRPVPASSALCVGLLGACVLALAVGMPFWLDSLSGALTAKFAFISPTMLVLVTPLLAILPLALFLANRRYALRRVPVWYGGLEQDPERASTTALTFSNAMRTF